MMKRFITIVATITLTILCVLVTNARIVNYDTDDYTNVNHYEWKLWEKQAQKTLKNLDADLVSRVKERMNAHGYYAETDKDKPTPSVVKKASWSNGE